MGPRMVTMREAQRQWDNAVPPDYWEAPDEDGEVEEVEEEEEEEEDA